MLPTPSQIAEWYDTTYAELSVSNADHFTRPAEAHRIFLKYLKPTKGQRVLDVGCGPGTFLSVAEAAGLETHGIDVSVNAVDVARLRTPRSRVTQSPAECIPYASKCFHHVVCLGVLEHTHDMGRSLDEMRRVGRDDAQFCIMVPNLNYYFWRSRPKKGTSQQAIKETLMTLHDWKDLLVRHGFVVRAVYHDRYFMSQIKLSSRLHPRYFLSALKKTLIWIFMPLNYTYQFIFICTKTPCETPGHTGQTNDSLHTTHP